MLDVAMLEVVMLEVTSFTPLCVVNTTTSSK